MNISLALNDPLRSRSHGPRPVGHHCRHFVSMGSAVVESLDSACEQPQLWWNRLGPDFSIDTFPPDSHPFLSEKAKLFDVLQAGESCTKPPLPDSIRGNGSMVFEERTEHSRLPRDVHFFSSDGDFYPQSVMVMPECLGESNDSSEETPETPALARVKLLCSYGGRIMPRPVDGKLRYVGGETRIIAVHEHIKFAEFMSKMTQLYGAPLGFKYQLPDEDLDALVSVSSDDDLQNMMEEYDKVGSSGSASRLRLFFFSAPAEVEVSEIKTDGEDGLFIPNQRYVDAINGLSGQLHINLLEDDAGGLHQVDGLNTIEGRGRVPSFEHVNEMSQLKGPSAPSSSPSSPPSVPRQTAYQKTPGLVELSLSEQLSKVIMVPKNFEGDVELEGAASSMTLPFHHQGDLIQYDQQFSLAADSPRVLHHDFLTSRGGENWSGMRRVDSQTKLGWQSEQHAEYRLNMGIHPDHWHELQHSREAVTHHGDHQCLIQQHKHSNSSQHQHHHQQQQHHHQRPPYHHHQQHSLQQQQQSWCAQCDVDSGRTDQYYQDTHRQPRGVHLHHQPSHHGHYNVSMHDQCSRNAEYHARSAEHNAGTPFIHGPTQVNPQILHGMAPAPPFQIGSAPSSPKVGVYDLQGKCSCGLQHSQVHRGITVSIGEQSHTRLPLHHGDQAVRKQSFWNALRFYDSASQTIDSSLWQQATHAMVTGEAEHREHGGGHWQQYPGRPPRDFHVTDSQIRSLAMQCSDTSVNERELQPTTIERPEMNKRCLFANCLDSIRQPVEMVVSQQTAFSEVPDQVPERVLHQKCSDSDGGRVSAARKQLYRVPSYNEESQRVDFADDRIVESESGLFVPLLQGDSESRKAMASYVDGGHRGRKPVIPLGVPASNVLAFDDTLVTQPSVQGPSDWHPSPRTSIGVPGNWADKLLSQQGQNFIAPSEASNISLRLSAASITPVILEEVANRPPALVSDVQHFNPTRHSFYTEEKENVGRAASAAPVLCSAASGKETADLESYGSKISTTAHGGTFMVSQDVIPLGQNSSMSAAGQGVPSPVSIVSTVQQATVSPLYDRSPVSSVNVVDFSCAASQTNPPPPDADKHLLASCMSSTEFLMDSLASSVLDSCLHEEFSSESSVAVQDMALINPRKATQDQSIAHDMDSSNTLGLSMTEPVKGLSPKHASMGKSCLETGIEKGVAGMLEDTGVPHVDQNSGVKKRSSEEHVSEVGILGMKDTEKSVLSDAEVEAIARGLQIIKNSDLEDLKELGSGTYGTVFHGKWRGSDVAIKRIKASCFTGPPSERERLISDFWKEACTLGQLHHPNVVAFYGVVPDGPGGTLATVTEFMVNGSLKQVLHKKDRTIDRRKRLFIAMDAAFGMEYLHSRNIVHFDLKCENLLVNMRDVHRPICKVGDFGLSKVKHQTLVSGGVRGTLPWMAPELLTGNSSMVSEKIDVFSFGIVMWELLTGEEPYANMHVGAIIGGIVNNTLRPSIPSWCDPGWRSLMERCWSGDPGERPTFAEVARELRAIAASMNLK